MKCVMSETKKNDSRRIPELDLMKYVNNYAKASNVESKLIFGNPHSCPDPFISIVIPTYRRPDFLKVSLDSALNQIYPKCKYEVIVVDNELTDQQPSETEKLIKQYHDPKLLYYRSEGIQGMVDNWNRCILLARAKWVAFHHDDDILLPEYINTILRLVSKKGDIACITASYYLLHEGDDIEQIEAKENSAHWLVNLRKLKYNKLMRLRQTDSNIVLAGVYGAPSCGSIFRKDFLIESGGFNDSFYPSFDWFFLYRYSKKYKLYRSIEKLGYYRVFENTSSLEITKAEFLRDRVMFADSVSRSTRLGRVMKFLFENEQNISILTAEFSNYEGKIAGEYFEQSKIKERRLRSIIYRNLIKLYWRCKMISALIFG